MIQKTKEWIIASVIDGLIDWAHLSDFLLLIAIPDYWSVILYMDSSSKSDNEKDTTSKYCFFTDHGYWRCCWKCGICWIRWKTKRPQRKTCKLLQHDWYWKRAVLFGSSKNSPIQRQTGKYLWAKRRWTQNFYWIFHQRN